MEVKTIESFSCQNCPKKFAKRMDYNRHRKTHDRPYICSLCDKSFGLNSDRKRHRAATHLNSPSKLSCPVPDCDYRGTVRKDHLLRHIRLTHRGDNSSICNNDNLRSYHNKIKPVETIERAAELDLDLLGASHQGDGKKLNELILKGGNVMAVDKYGGTPLHFACVTGHEAIVRLLLNTGKVDVDATDKYGDTPLSGAARNGHEAIVRLLLDTGKVDVNVTDKWGHTPLSMAAQNGHEAIVRLLLDTGKVGVDVTDRYGDTPLSRATQNGHEAIVRLLLDTGKVDVNTTNDYGNTPLSGAARNGTKLSYGCYLIPARSMST